MIATTKQIRFAALIRVSTERQEKRESLRTQRSQIKTAVGLQEGKIVKWYGGQEHATEGWEKQEFDRLLADAQKTPRLFDAVMITDPDRYSRDNLKAE